MTLVTLTAGRVPRERTKRKQTNGVMMVQSELKTQTVSDLLKRREFTWRRWMLVQQVPSPRSLWAGHCGRGHIFKTLCLHTNLRQRFWHPNYIIAGWLVRFWSAHQSLNIANTISSDGGPDVYVLKPKLVDEAQRGSVPSEDERSKKFNSDFFRISKQNISTFQMVWIQL